MTELASPTAVTDRGLPSKTFGPLVAFACAAALLLPAGASAQQFDNFDPSFGSNGVVLSDAASGANALALQPDGKIVVAGGSFDPQGLQELSVARFNGDGSPDSSFGSGGKVVMQLGAGGTPTSGAAAVALQPDGKILVAGNASDSSGKSEMLVARLSGADGSLDPSFHGNGVLAVQPGSSFPSSLLNAVAVQPDGKIVVAGQASNSNADSRLLVARLRADGSFDSSFGSGGKLLTQVGTPSGSAEQASSLALQPDGNIVVGGQAADAAHHVEFLVARLRAANGAFDKSFGSSGRVLKQLGAGGQPLSAVLTIALQPDGKILAGGDASPADGNPAFAVSRLSAGGTLDSSFGSAGTVVFQFGTGFGAFSSAASLAVQPDGNVVAAGSATDADGDSSLLVVRLSGSDGVLDGSFGSGGMLAAQLGGGDIPFSQGNAIAIQPDGRLLVGGASNTSGGSTDLMLARIFHDIAPSPAFSVLTNPAVAGAPVSFDASASSDPDGSVASYRWSFGDGGTAGGAGASHVFQSAGDYSVKLTVTDDKGLAASVTKTVSVAPGNQLSPALLATVSRLGISPAEFPAASKGGSISRHTGATVVYRDSRAATTTFEVRQAMLGTFSKGHCLKPSASLHGRRCARFVKIGEFSRVDQAGLNRFHFTGRLNGRKLKPGRYHLRAVPSVGGRRGIAARSRFVIVP